DGVLLRLIGKWLNAGVMESGELSYPEAGTLQGGVISPWRSRARPFQDASCLLRGVEHPCRLVRLVSRAPAPRTPRCSRRSLGRLRREETLNRLPWLDWRPTWHLLSLGCRRSPPRSTAEWGVALTLSPTPPSTAA